MQVFGVSKGAVEAPPENAYGAFFTHAAETMVVLDTGLCVVAANLAAQRTLGVTADDTGVGFETLLTEASSDSTLRSLQDVLEGHDLKDPYAVFLQRSNGSAFPASLTAARFEIDDSVLVGVVIHDRSESQAILEELQDEQQLYQSLFDLSPIALREEDFSSIGLWFTRLRRNGVTDIGDYLDANPSEIMDAIEGIKTVRVNRAMIDLMAAKDLAELESFHRDEMTAEVLDSFRHEFITLWEGGTFHEAEFLGLDLAGTPFECRLSMSVQSTDGRQDLSRVIVALQDVTEVRAYQRTLENLIAGKDRFVASISHELRTPLAAVLGLSQELNDMWDDFSSDEAHELMGLVARGANELASLVEDLLLAGQIKAGTGVRATSSDFDLTTEVTNAIEDCLASGDLTEAPAVADAVVRCHADPMRVRQIIRNLLINAGRYGGDTVQVLLSAAPQPTVHVIDEGPGIPTTEWDRIFNPFEQGSGTEAARGALGLGLAISKQLADVMQGSLTYRYHGGKSVFVLTLPAAHGSESG